MKTPPLSSAMSSQMSVFKDLTICYNVVLFFVFAEENNMAKPVLLVSNCFSPVMYGFYRMQVTQLMVDRPVNN